MPATIPADSTVIRDSGVPCQPDYQNRRIPARSATEVANCSLGIRVKIHRFREFAETASSSRNRIWTPSQVVRFTSSYGVVKVTRRVSFEVAHFR